MVIKCLPAVHMIDLLVSSFVCTVHPIENMNTLMYMRIKWIN